MASRIPKQVNTKQNLLFSLQEVCDITKLSYPAVFNMVKRGEIKAVKLGSRWRVNKAELDRITGIA